MINDKTGGTLIGLVCVAGLFASGEVLAGLAFLAVTFWYWSGP